MHECKTGSAHQLHREDEGENSLGRKEILQDGASFVHLLWHFNLHKKQAAYESLSGNSQLTLLLPGSRFSQGIGFPPS